MLSKSQKAKLEAEKKLMERYQGEYKWRLGRVRNKYLILEIMAYSGARNQSVQKIHKTSKMFRVLIIRNRQAFLKIVRKPQTKPDFDHTAMEHYGLNNKLNFKVRQLCGLKHVENFDLLQRNQILNKMKRVAFFRLLEQTSQIKPVLLFMKYIYQSCALYIDTPITFYHDESDVPTDTF